jgi:hypothetical protein
MSSRISRPRSEIEMTGIAGFRYMLEEGGEVALRIQRVEIGASRHPQSSGNVSLPLVDLQHLLPRLRMACWTYGIWESSSPGMTGYNQQAKVSVEFNDTPQTGCRQHG